jgi:hypothetical protein
MGGHSMNRSLDLGMITNHSISKSSTNFVLILSPFDNKLIIHKPREEWDVIHETKIRVLHKTYKHVFKQLYTLLCQDLHDKSETSQKRPIQDNKQEVMS